jgi:hypothetical protein
MSIAELLPRVRQVLPLTDIDALTRLTTTLCDVLETTLAVLPAPTNEAVAVPALTPTEFLQYCWTGQGWQRLSSVRHESTWVRHCLARGGAPADFPAEMVFRRPRHCGDEPARLAGVAANVRRPRAGTGIEFRVLASKMPGKCRASMAVFAGYHI